MIRLESGASSLALQNQCRSVNDIKLRYDPSFDELEAEVTQEPPSIRRTIGFFPAPNYMRLNFKLDLPMRIQNELSPLRSSERPIRTNTERFLVSIRQLYYAPVTFITCVDPTPDHLPSEAVVVVREFLRREFERVDHVRFEVLGPSPFHSDFYVEQSARQEEPGLIPFTCQRSHRLDYDRIKYSYNALDFNSVDEAREAIFDDIETYFDFYYHLEQSETTDANRFHDVSALVRELVDLEQRKGLKGHWARLWSSELRSQALMALTDFETGRVQRQVPTLRTYRELFAPGDKACIKGDIDDLTDAPLRFPVEETNRLLSLFESRRSSLAQNLFSATAGLVGVALARF